MFNAQIGVDRDTFFDNNANLIHHILRPLRSRLERSGIDYEDAYQVGSMGFMHAYEHYDPSRFDGGVTKFSTFAVPTIRGQVLRMIREHNPGAKYVRSVKELSSLIIREGVRDASMEEILHQLSLSEEKLKVKRLKITEEKVNQALLYLTNKHPYSTSMPISNVGENELYLEDILGEEEDLSTLFVEEFLSTLSIRDRQITELRMNGISQMEIGATVGLSQVQVSRLIQNKISKQLEDFQTGKTRTKKEIRPVNKTKQVTPEEKAIHLLANTSFTYADIAAETGVDYNAIQRMGKEHRPEDPTKLVKSGRYVGVKGDRKQAAELILAGGLNYDEITKITNVPLGSLTKVREYAEREKALGLPITGQALPRPVLKRLKEEEKTNNKKAEKKSPEPINFEAAPIKKEAPVKKATPVQETVPVVSAEEAELPVKIAIAPPSAPVRITPTSVDYEFEAGHVPAEHLKIQLDAIKQILSTSGNIKVSYTIGINIQGE